MHMGLTQNVKVRSCSSMMYRYASLVTSLCDTCLCSYHKKRLASRHPYYYVVALQLRSIKYYKIVARDHVNVLSFETDEDQKVAYLAGYLITI